LENEDLSIKAISIFARIWRASVKLVLKIVLLITFLKVCKQKFEACTMRYKKLCFSNVEGLISHGY